MERYFNNRLFLDECTLILGTIGHLHLVSSHGVNGLVLFKLNEKNEDKYIMFKYIETLIKQHLFTKRGEKMQNLCLPISGDIRRRVEQFDFTFTN